MTRHRSIRTAFSLVFQVKFCSLLFAGIAFSTWLLLVLTDFTLTDNYAESIDILLRLDSSIYYLIAGIFALQLILFLLASFVPLYVVSHRIAGPLYHLQRIVSKLSSGDLSCCIRIRKKDQLKTLEQELNHKAGELRQRYQSFDSLQRSLELYLEQPELSSPSELELELKRHEKSFY